jgi:hypothetical protein
MLGWGEEHSAIRQALLTFARIDIDFYNPSFGERRNVMEK